jgi:hypothetical protein
MTVVILLLMVLLLLDCMGRILLLLVLARPALLSVLLLLRGTPSTAGSAWLLGVLWAAPLLLLAEACLARLMRMASARGAAAPLTLRCSAAAWASIAAQGVM